MVKEAMRHFGPFRALVLGDFMLDMYTTGRVKRISPEAPVPVMEVLKQESRPGGAGNVVLNLAALGAEVLAVGRIGDDAAAVELKKLLSDSDTSSLLVEPQYKTPVKNRLIADSQQLIRVDFETLAPLTAALEEVLIGRLEQLISQVQVVALSDYGKGFLSDRLIGECLQMAKKANVPAVVDPKGADFSKYKGATVLKPNLSEAYAAVKAPPHASLDWVAREIFRISSAETLLITRSEEGISIFESDGSRFDFPVRVKEVKDVTGAGDTVLSMICLGLANGLDIQLATQLANIAAGLSIERVGCAQITLAEVAGRLSEFDSGKSPALKGKRCSLFVMEEFHS